MKILRDEDVHLMDITPDTINDETDSVEVEASVHFLMMLMFDREKNSCWRGEGILAV